MATPKPVVAEAAPETTTIESAPGKEKSNEVKEKSPHYKGGCQNR